MKVAERSGDPKLFDISKKGLKALVSCQGQEFNIESGEQPGKFIHELRKDGYERLVKLEKPWFVYPDNILRNYDSVDSTPLALNAIWTYWNLTKDEEFMRLAEPAVEKGISWITTYGDMDHDGIVEYELDPKRTFGGLAVQSWTDSNESLRNQDGVFPKYPIAPVETQAFAWLALTEWAGYFKNKKPAFAEMIGKKADEMKSAFNEKFLIEDDGLCFAAQALDGNKIRINTLTANPLLALWSAHRRKNGKIECIFSDETVNDVVLRVFKEDFFDEEAGIRTMSNRSKTYNSGADSYHNGSFWPMLNGLVYEGLLNFGYVLEAFKLKKASLKPIKYFGSPIELYLRNSDSYMEYRSPSGQTSCRTQAWSAASILHMLSGS